MGTINMRMAKASDEDITRAIRLSEVLLNVDRGYYPVAHDEEEGDFPEHPHFFDADDVDALKRFHELVMQHADGLHRVAWGYSTILFNNFVDPDLDYLAYHPRYLKALDAVRWRSVAEEMPPAGVPVIAFVAPNGFGKTRRIRAQYAGPKDLEQSPDAEGGVYDEDTDTFSCEEGWYETNEYEDVHWNVGGVVTHWLPLPELPEIADVQGEQRD